MLNEQGELPVVLVVPGERDGTYDWADRQVRVALPALVEGDVLLDRDWQVMRGDTIVAVDDDPDVTTPAPEPTSPGVPGAATPSEPSVVVDPGSLAEQDVPMVQPPSTRVIAGSADQFGNRDARDLAEAGIRWVAVVDPPNFGVVPAGMRVVVEAPEIQLLEVDPAQFLVAEFSRPQWPLLADGLLGTLALGLVVGAGPLRAGRELDPV